MRISDWSSDVCSSDLDKKMFTPASVLASTAKIFDGIQRAVVTTRTPDTNAAAKIAAVMKEDVSGLAGKRKALAPTAFSKHPAPGAPGKVVSRTAIPVLAREQIGRGAFGERCVQEREDQGVIVPDK